eukprot:PLAT6324.2.p1 GENE.PLAT6324.2~~PLAT6324.2.p1  ORF type:complete len:234 (+),score=75.16 PLAT6324.2:38-739(+)
MKALLAIALLLPAAAAVATCSFEAPDGTAFNFESLESKTTNFQVRGAQGGTYYASICTPLVISGSCNSKVSAVASYSSSNAGACQGVSLGDLSTAKWGLAVAGNSSDGVTATYSDGGACTSGGKTSVVYSFNCDEDASTPILVSGTVIAPCTHQLYFRTALACKGAADQLTTVSLVLILIGVFFVLYCCLGCIFNVSKKGASGKDIIPQYEMWAELGSLVKDGCAFTARGCRK